MVKVAGIGDLIFSSTPNDILKTFALSSCVAVIAYNSQLKKAGLIHIALPEAMNGDDMLKRPFYYAWTGIPLLINGMSQNKDISKNDLEIYVLGGADSIKKDDVFNIGKQNIQAVKTILKKHNLKYTAEEIGGYLSRTVEIDVSTGLIKVYTQPIKIC